MLSQDDKLFEGIGEHKQEVVTLSEMTGHWMGWSCGFCEPQLQRCNA